MTNSLDKHAIRIIGNGFHIRHTREEDVHGNWWKWLNDTDVTALMDKGHTVNTVEAQLAFFKKMDASPTDMVLAICDDETGTHIGTTALHSIDRDKGTAQFGIIIGEKQYWGRGIGSGAWALVVQYGFEQLGLTMITTMIFAENEASHHIARKMGFTVKEVLKDFIKKPDGAHDYVVLTLTRDNWEAARKDTK